MVLNHREKFKKVGLTGLFIILTFSLLLVLPPMIKTTVITDTQNPNTQTTMKRAVGEAVWSKTYGGTADDSGACVQQTSDGGYIIVGTSKSFGVGFKEVYLVKTNSGGKLQWYQTFGGPSGDRSGACVQQTSDGGYIIVGTKKFFGIGSEDVYLVKTNSEGKLQWNKTYGGESFDEGLWIEHTSDGGYIITGYAKSYGNGTSDVWLIKTDENGNHQWNKTYGGHWFFDYIGYCVEQTSDGGYIITGQKGPQPSLGLDVWLLKTDESGNQQWNKTYGYEGWPDCGYYVRQTNDGGYIITGSYLNYVVANLGSDLYLIKTDENGNKEWDRKYGSTREDDYGRCVEQTSDGGYIITGYTETFGHFSGDVWLIKTNSTGGLEWNKTYGGESFDAGRCVVQTVDGGYIIVGTTKSFGAGNDDVWLIKDSGEPPSDDNGFFGGMSIIIIVGLLAVIAILSLILIKKRIILKDTSSRI